MAAVILQQNAPELRRVAELVPTSEFGKPKLKNTINELKAALAAEADGVAIAAPQLGINQQIFVVSQRALGKAATTDLVFINPTIIKQAKQTKLLEEGCLSVRWIYGLVRRATKVSVSAYDTTGKKFTYHGSSLLAQIFQHEIDHLRGILFIDQATRVTEVKPPTNVQ